MFSLNCVCFTADHTIGMTVFGRMDELLPVLCQSLISQERLLSLLHALIRSREVLVGAQPDTTPIQETGEGLQRADSDGEWIVPAQPSDEYWTGPTELTEPAI